MRTRTTMRAVLLASFLAACVTTPLPLPPSVDPALVDIIGSSGPSVLLTGGPGAVDGVDAIRITVVDDRLATEPDRREVPVAEDGSFEVVLSGSALEDRFFIEALTEDEDLFLIALRSLPDGTTIEADPGPDSDGDRSPDAIDCAPDDDSFGGRRCP